MSFRLGDLKAWMGHRNDVAVLPEEPVTTIPPEVRDSLLKKFDEEAAEAISQRNALRGYVEVDRPIWMDPSHNSHYPPSYEGLRRPAPSGKYPPPITTNPYEHLINNLQTAVASLTADMHAIRADLQLAREEREESRKRWLAVPCLPEDLVSTGYLSSRMAEVAGLSATAIEEGLGGIMVRLEEIEQDLYGDA